VSSVTVVAEQAARADALATALLVLGPDEGIAFAEREHIAALFLQRSGDRIEERMTARFIEEFGQ
jgi:thiamine biosynthesis lipoprotein